MKINEFIDSIGGPTILVFIGALISAVGAVWAGIEQNRSSDILASKNDKIADLSREIANSITGGSSACYITPIGNSIDVAALVSVGEYPLYDLSVRITDLDLMEQMRGQPVTFESMQLNEKNIDLGSLPPGSFRILGRGILDIHGDSRRWNIFFCGRNGVFTQILRMKKVAGDWEMATKVQRNDVGTDPKVEIIHERISENFPRNEDGTVNWD